MCVRSCGCARFERKRIQRFLSESCLVLLLLLPNKVLGILALFSLRCPHSVTCIDLDHSSVSRISSSCYLSHVHSHLPLSLSFLRFILIFLLFSIQPLHFGLLSFPIWHINISLHSCNHCIALCWNWSHRGIERERDHRRFADLPLKLIHSHLLIYRNFRQFSGFLRTGTFRNNNRAQIKLQTDLPFVCWDFSLFWCVFFFIFRFEDKNNW